MGRVTTRQIKGGEGRGGGGESLCMHGWFLGFAPLWLYCAWLKQTTRRAAVSVLVHKQKFEVFLDAQKLEIFPHKRRKGNPSRRRCQIEAVTCCFASSTLVVSESQTFHLIFSAIKLGGKGKCVNRSVAGKGEIDPSQVLVCMSGYNSFPLLLVFLPLFAFN